MTLLPTYFTSSYMTVNLTLQAYVTRSHTSSLVYLPMTLLYFKCMWPLHDMCSLTMVICSYPPFLPVQRPK